MSTDFQSSLFRENGSYSLGRISYWIVFGIFITYLVAGLTGYVYTIFWLSNVNINPIEMIKVPESLVQMLLILLGYNLGKKAVFAFEKSAVTKYTSGNNSFSPGYASVYPADYASQQMNYGEPTVERHETQTMHADIDYKGVNKK